MDKNYKTDNILKTLFDLFDISLDNESDDKKDDYENLNEVLFDLFNYFIGDNKCEDCKCEHEEPIEVNKQEVKFERPSSKLTTEQGLQLHKLTQEYVDTMVKPYAKNHMSEQAINDAYVGLYEFAAWILLKK